MRCRQVIGLGAMVLACSAGPLLADPSFDCSLAQTPDETAICADPQLAKLDTLVAGAFAAYQPEFQTRAAVSRALLAERRACGEDAACIAAAQLNALDTYGGDAPWADDLVSRLLGERAKASAKEASSSRLPRKLAQCVKTRITGATTRFGEPLAGSSPDTGIYVTYANGGNVVSYGRDAGFDGIEAGQQAVMCLMSVPHDCPAGDDRGRIYYTLDLATGGSWIAPDSQHSCGGA